MFTTLSDVSRVVIENSPTQTASIHLKKKIDDLL